MTETRPYPQRARERITGSKVLTRLIDHVEGKIELTNSQVNAARILLAKVLPDVRTTEITGSVQVTQTHLLSDEQLLAIAAGACLPEAIEGEVVPTPKKLRAEA